MMPSTCLQMPHPWASAQQDCETRLLPLLKADGKIIGAQSQQDNELAKAVIHYYDMLQRSFDPMTMLLLEEAYNQWKEREQQPKRKTR